MSTVLARWVGRQLFSVRSKLPQCCLSSLSHLGKFSLDTLRHDDINAMMPPLVVVVPLSIHPCGGTAKIGQDSGFFFFLPLHRIPFRLNFRLQVEFKTYAESMIYKTAFFSSKCTPDSMMCKKCRIEHKLYT